MRVKAIKPGFFGGARRYPGDVFEVPKGTKGAWFVPADGAPTTSPKASGPGGTEQPRTGSTSPGEQDGAGGQ